MSVKDMTDQQLNRGLAELMGYIVTEGEHDLWPEWYELKKNGVVQSGDLDKDWAWGNAPDYCNDPAASLEVQEKAMDKDEIGYMTHLVFRTGHSYSEGLNYETAADMLRATPRQRAEAAYMTLSNRD